MPLAAAGGWSGGGCVQGLVGCVCGVDREEGERCCGIVRHHSIKGKCGICVCVGKVTAETVRICYSGLGSWKLVAQEQQGQHKDCCHGVCSNKSSIPLNSVKYKQWSYPVWIRFIVPANAVKERQKGSGNHSCHSLLRSPLWVLKNNTYSEFTVVGQMQTNLLDSYMEYDPVPKILPGLWRLGNPVVYFF